MQSLPEHIALGMGIAFHAKNIPDKNAVISEYGTRTFQELNANSNCYANFLLANDLVPGDSVAIICKNRPEFLEALFGPLRVGMRITPINWHLTPEEICYIVENCEAKVVVCDAIFSDFFEEIKANLPEVILMAADGENSLALPFMETIQKYDDSDISDPIAGRSMLYTSGTTGRPKGVFRKENPPPSKTEQLTLDTAAFNPEEDFSICPGPAYHAAPLGLNINPSLMAGVGVYLMDKWDAEKMLSLISEYECTHTHMVATMFHRILRLPEETRSKYDLSSMRWILHGAAPCPVEVKQAMIDWMGPIVYEYYAATEGGGCFIQPEEWLKKPGSVGKANEGTEVKILDEDFKEVDPGKEGTIYFSAPSKGRFEYYKAEEKTSGAYWGDYFTMGDIGYCDSDGYHFLTGRSADTIISGGTNIYPQEIDNVLLMHDQVAEVCCIGVPNEEWGEEIKAVINLEEGADEEEVLKELLALAEESLSGFKKPKSYEFWEEDLPRLPTGKIQRNLVKKRFW
jgi:long-chain acyl-CoA synthetase|tara:strand:+ start:1169 stop:2707 length:1539 start_codon:yes stop_codon:yes gene_type:complete